MPPQRHAQRTGAFGHFVLQGEIVDQAAFLADLGHHVIAGVDAQRAGDAGQLLTVPDIDARGADRHAGATVDAVTQPVRAFRLAVLSPRLAPPVSICHRQRVLIHHRRLHPRPWAHVDANLFAHEPAEDDGRQSQDGDGRPGDRVGVQGHKVARQRGRVREVEHPGPTGGDPDQRPDRPFGHPQAGLADRPRRVPQLHAGVPVAFDPAFHQDHQVGPDGLRAGVAAPDPAQRRGEQEQPQPRHDQKARDEVEFVRPDLDPEEVEAPVRQVDQHSLVGQVRATVPANPGRQVVDRQSDPHDPPLERTEGALNAAGEHGFAGSVERRWLIGRRHGFRASCSESCRPCRPRWPKRP